MGTKKLTPKTQAMIILRSKMLDAMDYFNESNEAAGLSMSEQKEITEAMDKEIIIFEKKHAKRLAQN